MDFALALFGAAADPAGASALSTYGTVALNILLVILGINALIIVHEFGHFIVARACGVRCEKFYIWFDFWGLKFFKFKWGDTEYGLGVFPLGGYVKMLGQEDNPGELRAEMERAKQASSEQERLEEWTGAKALKADGLVDEQEAKELTGTAESQDKQQTAASETTAAQPTRSVEELQEEIFAPDSYLAKNVPQRMAIICAGVIMNFLFAILCGTMAYMVGVEDTAPVVGSVIAGSPAWEAGIRTGDRIVAINDNTVRAFVDINLAMVGGEKGITVSIERPNGSETEKLDLTVYPVRGENDLAPRMGVTSAGTLGLVFPKKPEEDWVPVYSRMKSFYSADTLDALKARELRITAVDGVKVRNYTEFQELQQRRFGQPIRVEFTPVVAASETAEQAAPPEPFTVTIPAIPMKEIGVRFKTGPVVSVLAGSDAEKKGVKVGDTILSVDGDSQFDPLKLPQVVLRKMQSLMESPDTPTAPISVELLLKKADGREETVSVELNPAFQTLSALASQNDPVGSTALGLAWRVEPEVVGGEKVPEGRVLSVFLKNSDALLQRNSFCKASKEGFLIRDIGDKIDVPLLFDYLVQLAAPKPLTDKEKEAGKTEPVVSVELEIEKPDGAIVKVDLPIVESKEWFFADRGLLLKGEMDTVKIDNFGEALSVGTGKMIEYSKSVFVFLKQLAGGGISPKALGGPVMIVQAAYAFVEKGPGAYLLFLCLIGANLAVINILPIPVLDGGHVVFLAYEGITGRAPNETVQVVLSYMGLALILGLMVWVLALDIGCILRV